MSRAGFALAALLGMTLAAATGRADAVFPQRLDCPDGSEPVPCHGLPTCRARTCTSDADCTDGGRCEEASFCRSDRPCGGPSRDPVYLHLEVECGDGRPPCAAPGTCEALRTCRGARALPSEAPTEAPTSTPAAPAATVEPAETPTWLVWTGVGLATVIAVLVALWMARNKRSAPML